MLGVGMFFFYFMFFGLVCMFCNEFDMDFVILELDIFDGYVWGVVVDVLDWFLV